MRPAHHEVTVLTELPFVHLNERPLAELDLTTVAEFGLGVQAWAGQTTPDWSRSLQPSMTGSPIRKPNDGFFTSTWNGMLRSSAWTEYMHTVCLRIGEGRSLWTLVPNPRATLYIVECQEHFELLANRYPQLEGRVARHPLAPDWHLIGTPGHTPFDGLHVTKEAAEVGKRNLPPAFGGWDVESTLWLTSSFIGEPECVSLLDDDWILAND